MHRTGLAAVYIYMLYTWIISTTVEYRRTQSLFKFQLKLVGDLS